MVRVEPQPVDLARWPALAAPAGLGGAAAGLVAYFTGAAIGHLRVGDTKGLAMPIAPLLLSIVVLALRLTTL